MSEIVVPSPQLDAATGSGKTWKPVLDLVRIFAAVLVVCVHCNCYFADARLGVDSPEWLLACVVASFSRICVPLFFLLSGCLLLKSGMDPASFYRKRFGRVLLPLVFWSFVYIIVRIFLEDNRISLLSALRLIYNGEVYYHLGFLYSLVSVYLALPLFSPFAERGRWGILVGYASLAFVLGSAVPFCDKMLTAMTGVPFHLGVPAGSFWVYSGYAVAGAVVGQLPQGGRRGWIALAVLVASFAMTVCLTVGEARREGPSELWFGYAELPVVMASLAAFVLLSAMPVPAIFQKPFRIMGNLSMGIYLSHPLVLAVFKKLDWVHPESSFTGIPLRVGIVLAISSALAVLLSRIPVMRKFQ